LGTKENIKELEQFDNFKFIEKDLSLNESIEEIIKFLSDIEIDIVWHLAANSDIRGFVNGPNVDINNTFLTTVNICKIMETLEIKNILFASSSAVIGNTEKPISETFGPSLPISYYGAMKLASEGYISSSISYFLDNYIILRFPNVVGPNLTHGVIYDFKKKLVLTPNELNVLGNGKQKKPYLYLDDLIDAMKYYNTNHKNLLINISPLDEGITVEEIVEITLSKINRDVDVNYELQEEGWQGDVIKYSYNTDLQKKLGWKPKYSSLEAIEKTIDLTFE
tara:strand:- start:1549 stop:2385 length:837 start_codon:yes stop_codon:yes gene_type:complete